MLAVSCSIHSEQVSSLCRVAWSTPAHRGNIQQAIWIIWRRLRSTPAQRGKTWEPVRRKPCNGPPPHNGGKRLDSAGRQIDVITVHPRTPGENGDATETAPRRSVHPRTPGENGDARSCFSHHLRSTPARRGKPPLCGRGRHDVVHPRTPGNDPCAHDERRSTPAHRGKTYAVAMPRRQRIPIIGRSTPAPRGKTMYTTSLRCAADITVHPRTPGEKRRVRGCPAHRHGPPPHNGGIATAMQHTCPYPGPPPHAGGKPGAYQ